MPETATYGVRATNERASTIRPGPFPPGSGNNSSPTPVATMTRCGTPWLLAPPW